MNYENMWNGLKDYLNDVPEGHDLKHIVVSVDELLKVMDKMEKEKGQ